MTKDNLVLLSNDDLIELKSKLTKLKEVCYPPITQIQPQFKFKHFHEFNQFDGLFYGASMEYKLSPTELNQLYQHKEELNDVGIDFIKTKKGKWFYNLFDFNCTFFSQDGQKKVEVAFHTNIFSQKLCSNPKIKAALKAVLEMCDGNNFPTQNEVMSCFPDDLCHMIYDKNPIKKAVEFGIVGLIEPLRKKIFDNLNKYHSQLISQSPEFKEFLNQNTFLPNTPEIQKIRIYLTKNKQTIYIWGEKVGLIRNANRMIRYEQVRNHTRHSDKIKSVLIKPHEVFHDFEKALSPLINKHDLILTNENIYKKQEVFERIKIMSQILSMLEKYEDPKLKKKKDKTLYWQNLIQKGLIHPSELNDLEKLLLCCNSIAHANSDSEQAKETILNDTFMEKIYCDISDRFEKLEREKHLKLKRWIKENSYVIS